MLILAETRLGKIKTPTTLGRFGGKNELFVETEMVRETANFLCTRNQYIKFGKY